MNFIELSDRCRTAKARDVLSVALEASTTYSEKEKPVIAEVVEIVAFVVNSRRNRQLQRERIRDGVERFMPDGKYSSLRGLAPRAQERGNYSPQSEASINNLFCTGQ